MPSDTKKAAMSSLDQLKATGTFIVADTGDFEVSLRIRSDPEIFFPGSYFSIVKLF